MTAQDEQSRILLTVSEAARRLALGRATTYRLVQLGELPCVRIGRAVRVPAQALELWIATRTTGGPQVSLRENYCSDKISGTHLAVGHVAGLSAKLVLPAAVTDRVSMCRKA